ncbi:MAG: rhomboid family intramembrane serine protease [Acidimicrobiales bacterium]
MHQASIGHHCPACTSNNSQKVYTPRNMPGGGVTVVMVLMALNALAFVGQQASNGRLTSWGRLLGQNPFAGTGVADGEWWRVITSAFLHGSLLHIGFNMYALWILGNSLEEGVGKLRFGLLYLAGLLGGSFAVLAFDFNVPTLGASGAVLGLAGALAAVLWARGVSLTQTPLGFILALNLGLPILVGGISFWGHFGGIAAGFIAGWLLAWLPGRFGQSPQVALAATVAFCALLVVGIVTVVGAGGLL